MGGSLAILGQQTGLPGTPTQNIGPFSIPPSAIGETFPQALTTGNNTITVPAGSPQGVLIIPPAANANTITLKGVNADTGIRIAPALPTEITFDTSSVPSTFVVNVGGNTTITFQFF